jgi:hypothetical protein
MHRTLALISSLAALACALGALGCSSNGSGGGSQGCSSATVSFSKDVIPVFEMGCTLSHVCHGQMGNSAEQNLYLGGNTSDMTMTDVQAVYKGLVGVTAKEDTSMKLVTADDPQSSYLFHKVHDDQATLNSTLGSACMATNSMCSNCNSGFGPCGATMPYSGTQLPSGSLCTIQNWIQQGAQNN